MVSRLWSVVSIYNFAIDEFKYTVGLRVSEEQEMLGLDISEHGMFGYPERFIDVSGAESSSSEKSAPAPAASE